MKLLLTNDDGIQAPGLAALEQAVHASAAEIVVVAPRDPFSSCGHQITTHRPLSVDRLADQRFAVDGSPADCARLALLHLCPDADWLLAGVNAGGNLGVDIHMSGTVAAAREAALLGRRAIALSQYHARGSRFDWDYAARMAARVFEYLRDLPLPANHFWNVNFPDLQGEPGEPPIVICPPDVHPLAIAYQLHDGQYHYRGVYQQRKYRPGTDVDHCFRGYLTVSSVSAGIVSSA